MLRAKNKIVFQLSISGEKNIGAFDQGEKKTFFLLETPLFSN